jgi:hypothetical protein
MRQSRRSLRAPWISLVVVSVMTVMLAVVALMYEFRPEKNAAPLLEDLYFGTSCEEVRISLQSFLSDGDLGCERLSVKPLIWYTANGKVEVQPYTILGVYSERVLLPVNGEEYTVRFDFVQNRLVLITYTYRGETPQHILRYFSDKYGVDSINETVNKYGITGDLYTGVIEWPDGIAVYFDGRDVITGYRWDTEWYAEQRPNVVAR